VVREELQTARKSEHSSSTASDGTCSGP
jgi:hypothetical protein